METFMKFNEDDLRFEFDLKKANVGTYNIQILIIGAN